ncbi:MAG: AtpZ/AtpI family protein [Patescibacteria group bacterium]
MPHEEPQKPWWQPALTVFGEVTGWIAAPILIALFSGRYLDEKFDSEPWFFLGLTAAAFIVSTVGIVQVAGKYIKQLEKDSTNSKKTHERSNGKHNS